jgi:hypothetical protein
MKLSGGGEYRNNIHRDLQEVAVKKDGLANLGHIMKLRLGGWLVGNTDYVLVPVVPHCHVGFRL